MSMKGVARFLSFIIGIAFILLGAIPACFEYPYSDGPNSGPTNSWDLILIIAHEQWPIFLFIGFIFCLFFVFLLLKARDHKKPKR